MGANEDLLLWVQNIGTRFGFASASAGPGGGAATCEPEPVRPSEVLSGSSSSQYSTGEITDETAAEGQDFTTGTRENAESDDFDQATSSYTGGSNPMQSPNLGGRFAQRYGIGFLCFNYNTWNDLTEVQGYQSPTSTYQQAFRGMNKTQQFNDPTAAQILAGIKTWIDKLATALNGCGQGELVVSFQGHGQGGSIYGVDEVAVTPAQLMALARQAEGKQVSITYVLDACESGGAVPQFQHHAADRVDESSAATQGAGEVCSEENEATARQLGDMMAHAREMILNSEAIGRHGTAMLSAASAVQNATNAAALNTAWTAVMNLNQKILGEVQAMQRQLENNYDFGNDPEMHLDVIEQAFTTLITALNTAQVHAVTGAALAFVTALPFDLDNNWAAKVGDFQDTISDGANLIIRICNSRAQEYTSSHR